MPYNFKEFSDRKGQREKRHQIKINMGIEKREEAENLIKDLEKQLAEKDDEINKV